MKNLKIIPTQLIVITFLLIYLNSCYGQIENKNATNEDGKVNLTHQPNIYNAMSNSMDKNIRSIYQDRKGNYWFGTNGAGVYRYDTKTLTQFIVKNGLADNQVINIQEDDLGNIWFGTGKFGISKFDGTKFTTHTNKVKITNGTETDWKSTNNNLWFYGGGGVFRHSDSLLDYLPFVPLSSTAQTNAPFYLVVMAFTVSSRTKKEMFGSVHRQKEFADMMGKLLPGLKKKVLLVLQFLVYLKIVRAIFGLVIMVLDYSDMMERL